MVKTSFLSHQNIFTLQPNMAFHARRTGKSTGSDPVDTWNPVLLPRSIYPLLLLLRVSAGIVGGYF